MGASKQPNQAGIRSSDLSLEALGVGCDCDCDGDGDGDESASLIVPPQRSDREEGKDEKDQTRTRPCLGTGWVARLTVRLLLVLVVLFIHVT